MQCVWLPFSPYKCTHVHCSSNPRWRTPFFLHQWQSPLLNMSSISMRRKERRLIIPRRCSTLSTETWKSVGMANSRRSNGLTTTSLLTCAESWESWIRNRYHLLRWWKNRFQKASWNLASTLHDILYHALSRKGCVSHHESLWSVHNKGKPNGGAGMV